MSFRTYPSSGDGEGSRLIGCRDDQGRRWCFQCVEAVLVAGEAEPAFVEDLSSANGADRQANCSQCNRSLMMYRNDS